jgi:hypothetical protein
MPYCYYPPKRAEGYKPPLQEVGDEAQSNTEIAGKLFISIVFARPSARLSANFTEPKRIVSLLKYSWQGFLSGKSCTICAAGRLPLQAGSLKWQIRVGCVLNRFSYDKSWLRLCSAALVLRQADSRCTGWVDRRRQGSLVRHSSGLKMPTRRNTFPIIRTMGRILTSIPCRVTLFLTHERPS